MKREVNKKLQTIANIKPNQAAYTAKELLCDDSAPTDNNQRELLEWLDTVINCGEDVVVDLRKMNGKIPKFERFWEVSTFALFQTF